MIFSDFTTFKVTTRPSGTPILLPVDTLSQWERRAWMHATWHVWRVLSAVYWDIYYPVFPVCHQVIVRLHFFVWLLFVSPTDWNTVMMRLWFVVVMTYFVASPDALAQVNSDFGDEFLQKLIEKYGSDGTLSLAQLRTLMNNARGVHETHHTETDCITGENATCEKVSNYN